LGWLSPQKSPRGDGTGRKMAVVRYETKPCPNETNRRLNLQRLAKTAWEVPKPRLNPKKLKRHISSLKTFHPCKDVSWKAVGLKFRKGQRPLLLNSPPVDK